MRPILFSVLPFAVHLCDLGLIARFDYGLLHRFRSGAVVLHGRTAGQQIHLHLPHSRRALESSGDVGHTGFAVHAGDFQVRGFQLLSPHLLVLSDFNGAGPFPDALYALPSVVCSH